MAPRGSTAVATVAAAPVQNRQSSFTHVIEHWPTYVELAMTLSKSGKTGEIRSKESVMAVLVQGSELGLTPMVALNCIHPIGDKLSLSASAAQALVLRDLPGSKFSITEKPDVCEVTLAVPGRDPYTAIFTMEDAKLAGLVKRGGNWEKSPKDMLFSKAVLRACRRVAPDVLAGMYSPEELGSIDPNVIDTTARENDKPATTPTAKANDTVIDVESTKPVPPADGGKPTAQPVQPTVTAPATTPATTPPIAKEEPKAAPAVQPKPAETTATLADSTVASPMANQAPGTQSSTAQHLEMKRLFNELKMAPSEFKTLFQSMAKPRNVEKATELNFAEADRFIRLLRVRLQEAGGATGPK